MTFFKMFQNDDRLYRGSHYLKKSMYFDEKMPVTSQIVALHTRDVVLQISRPFDDVGNLSVYEWLFAELEFRFRGFFPKKNTMQKV